MCRIPPDQGHPSFPAAAGTGPRHRPTSRGIARPSRQSVLLRRTRADRVGAGTHQRVRNRHPSDRRTAAQGLCPAFAGGVRVLLTDRYGRLHLTVFGPPIPAAPEGVRSIGTVDWRRR